MTPQAKRRIFGLNAAKLYDLNVEKIRKAASTDTVGKLRQAYREAPNPSVETLGPKTRREFLSLLTLTKDRPG